MSPKIISYITFITLLCWTAPSIAQTNLLGIQAGVSASTVLYTDRETLDYRFGLGVELNSEYFFSNHFSFVFGGSYTQKGFRIPLDFTDENGNPIGIYNTTYKFDYLGFPLKVGYTTGDRIFFTSRIGFVPMILIKSESLTPGIVTPEGVDYVLDLRDITAKIDFSPIIEFELRKMLSEKLGLTVLMSFQHSFTDLYTTPSKSKSIVFFGGMGVKYVME